MTPRMLALLLAAAALMLAACGGSSKRPATTTSAQVTSTAAPPAVTTTTTSTTHKRTATVKQPKPRKLTAQPAAPSPALTATTPNAGIPRSAHVSGPTPIICLKAAGLITVHATQESTWEGLVPGTKVAVYVDGPYKTKAQAKASAKSLAGVEEEAAGGLYDVTAYLSAHVKYKVSEVTQCLSNASGRGTLTF